MKSRHSGRKAPHLRCLSCGAILDGPFQSYCDAECEAYAKKHKHANYQTPRVRSGIPYKHPAMRRER